MNQATATAEAGETARPSGAGRWTGVLRFLPALTAVAVTVWVFRAVLFDGQLPGDFGDSRWTIAVHEHWYRVWTGQEPIRDLHYYFPLPRTLGTSDAYLAQGLIYSVARLVGFGLVDAWLIACIGTFLIGALGVGVLSRQLLDHVLSQVAFVALACASYAVYSGSGHVQLYGMLAVSWIFVGLYDLVGRRRVRRGVALLVVVPPVLALSSWYPMVLGFIVLALLGLSLALFSSGAGIQAAVRRVVADLWTVLRSVTGIVLVVAFVVLWVAVLWVYMPSRNLLPNPTWGEVALYSPQWSDLWNATGSGGGVWSSLYDRFPLLGQANSELAYGFTPILFVTFVAASLGVLRVGSLSERPAPAVDRAPSTAGRLGVLAAAVSVALILVFFLVDERGLSLYLIPWHVVPGLESIRSPFRVMSIVYGIIAFVVLRSLELGWRDSAWLDRGRGRRAGYLALSVLLMLAVFVEMQRPLDTRWTRADLLPPDLLAQVDAVQQSGCQALVVLDPNPGATWVNAIDAVILSTLTGVPTPQGYSRADPVDYPNSGALDYDPMELVEWMRGQGFDGSVCAVSAGGVTVVE